MPCDLNNGSGNKYTISFRGEVVEDPKKSAHKIMDYWGVADSTQKLPMAISMILIFKGKEFKFGVPSAGWLHRSVFTP